MADPITTRPGQSLFVGGILCLVAAAALGAFLAHEAITKLSHLAPTGFFDGDGSRDTEPINSIRGFLANVNALMWMIFGLGACLTMVGLRMMTRPDIPLDPSPRLGSIREVFENRE